MHPTNRPRHERKTRIRHLLAVVVTACLFAAGMPVAEATTSAETVRTAAQTVEIAAAPAAPCCLRVFITESNGAKVTFLDQSSDETSFVVERARVFTNAWTRIATVIDNRSGQPTSVREYTESVSVDHLASDTYCVRAGARNASGTAYTVPETKIITDDCSAASRPTETPSFQFTTIGQIGVSLQITRRRLFEYGYFVNYRRADSSTWITAKTVLPTTPWTSGSVLNQSVGQLDSGVRYCFQVFGWNPRGNSPLSAERCATTREAEPCPGCLASPLTVQRVNGRATGNVAV